MIDSRPGFPDLSLALITQNFQVRSGLVKLVKRLQFDQKSIYIKDKICMYVCMYVLTSPPRLLNRIQPNFPCPLEVTMAP